MELLQKIVSLLSSKQKKQAIVLLVLVFIGMSLEMLGVGLIFPILALMTEPNLVEKYPFIQPVMEYLGTPSQSQLIVWSMIALSVFYAFKVLFLIYIAWRKVLFSTTTKAYFSRKLFSGYLRLPYTFHLQYNSADLMRNVLSDVKSWNKGLLSVMDLITDGMILVGVFALLFWVEPVGAILITLFLAGTGGGLHRVTRTHAARWGEERRYHGGKVVQHLLQGFGGVKELKLFGREKGFKTQFDTHNKGFAKVDRWQKVLAVFPRLWFELLVIVGLMILVLALITQGKAPSELVPILGLFAASAFRLMPSMVRISTALQSLHFCGYAVEKLHGEFSMLKVEKERLEETVLFNQNMANAPLDSWNYIQVKGLFYSYPNSNHGVLNGVDFIIKKNESVGFIGGSGAGKSTLIDIILGLLTVERGRVLLDDNSIHDSLRQWQNEIGYVPQTIYLTDDTVCRNIAFGLSDEEINSDAVFAAIKSAQLEGFIASLEHGIDTLVGEQGVRISGGQRQRIGIARALYQDPSVLVLDEATSALDVETEKEVMSAVNALHGKKTIITIAHRMSTVKNCDHLYRLDKGRIIQEGTYEEVVHINN